MRHDKIYLKIMCNKKYIRQCVTKGVATKNDFKPKGYFKRQSRKAERAEGKKLKNDFE